MHRLTRFPMLLLAVLFLISPRPAAAQGCLLLGDVTRDGHRTPKDALMVFQAFLGIVPLDRCQQVLANVAEPTQEAITPADALCIFRNFLGLASCLDTVPSSVVATRLMPAITDLEATVAQSVPLAVQLGDRLGDMVPRQGIPVTFEIVSQPQPSQTNVPLSVVQPSLALTDAQGRATTELTLGVTASTLEDCTTHNILDPIQVRASVAGLPESCSPLRRGLTASRPWAFALAAIAVWPRQWRPDRW